MKNLLGKLWVTYVIWGFIFLLLLIYKINLLSHFGFVYTDIDQVLMWNGAIDYSKGIFHEPFFYGQAYNFMLEAFLAVPLLWGGMLVYEALPTVSTFLSVLPLVFLSVFLLRKKHFFWATLCLVFPLLLPIEYSLLTAMPRGFLQAHLFFPLLFAPLLWPQYKHSISLLYLASALCIIANESAFLLVVPVFFYVGLKHYKTVSFYWKALWMTPIFAFDFWAKYFYELHSERIVHSMSGLSLKGETFLQQASNTKLFEHLFPFVSGWGIVYPFVFIFLAFWAKHNHKTRVFWFIIVVLLLLTISLFVPKIHEVYPNGGLFFTSSRLYLTLPLLLFLGLYLMFKHIQINIYLNYVLLLTAIVFFVYKTENLTTSIGDVVKNTSFPVIKNKDLILQINELEKQTKKHNVDVIVNTIKGRWKYHFENYAYYPLTQSQETIAVSQTNDRRYWLYEKALKGGRLLLNGIQLDATQRKKYQALDLGNRRSLVFADSTTASEIIIPRTK